MATRCDYFTVCAVVTMCFLVMGFYLAVVQDYYFSALENNEFEVESNDAFNTKVSIALFWSIYTISALASFFFSWEIFFLVEWVLDKFCMPSLSEEYVALLAKHQAAQPDVEKQPIITDI
ncbi:hypothetical protein CAEBREN_10293 [Caenorhabditis brenneri]|uniref:Uncharacterized protein n=1 Tax=Caenorhabditis brenneri TaxID=135651 RepID=G0NGE2_CAEBE|nr:hypothetical protein CAEBREN_10293 [Caenorhabditis brenneri]